jgi:hypothetical protein
MNPEPKPFNRAEHCRRIAAHGGSVTAQRYGAAHMRAIGKAGAQATIQKHGVDYFQGIVKRKGWNGRRSSGSPSLDLAVGKLYATW